MIGLKYTAKDFCIYENHVPDCVCHSDSKCLAYADRANQLLDEALKEAPRIGHYCRPKYKHCEHERGRALWSTPKKFDTHQAILIRIEEIKK